MSVPRDEELCWRSASELLELMSTGAVSSEEVLDAHLDRIARVNPDLNAIVTLDPDAARETARALDKDRTRGRMLGPLAGLPIAVKDLEDTAGMRTTYGSPLFADHVPGADGLLAEALRAADAVVIGKTNTPEFGAGSQTFNAVFGATRNPYDLGSTVGGSSGGAAAAVASAMTPIADGSDLGASVRNPASFCNVAGLRPSPGRWPNAGEGADLWNPMSVLGPIARSVADCWLLFTALARSDSRSAIPSGLSEAEARPLDPSPSLRGLRVAWSENLGGLPVEAEVLEVLEPHRNTFEELGCSVTVDEPDIASADEAFETLRAVLFVAGFQRLVEDHPDQVKSTVRWEVERGLALDASRIARAQVLRSRTFEVMRRFLGDYDVLALPVCQVAPFPVETEWVGEIAGQSLDHYLAWMRSCSRITVTSHPAVSVPAGFTRDGRPVGIQLVGRYRDERCLMHVARAFEAATGFGRERPPL